MNEGKIYTAALKLLEVMDKTVDKSLPKEIAEIVKFHSKGAAAAGVASGWIPGAGGIMAVTVSAGFVWSMYARINKAIDMPFSENIGKTLASGIATNLGASYIGGIAISSALSFLPGIGSLASSVIVGGICYALTLASGFVYLKTLTLIYQRKMDPSKLSVDDLKDIAKSVAENEDIKSVINEAKAEYKASKKS